MTIARVLVVLTSSAAAFAQQRLEGLVRNSITGAPIAGVDITIESVTSGRAQPPHRLKTGDNGHFHRDGLGPGRYLVKLKRLGFVDSEYPGGPLPIVTLPAPDPLAIDLVPAGSLEGRVLDEDDKPVNGVSVYASSTAAQPRFSVAANEGVYRIEFLAPDTYRVDVRVPFEFRDKTKVRDQESGEVRAYPNYQPRIGAAPISPNATLSGFDLHLRRSQVAALGGRAIDALTHEPLAGGGVALVSAEPSLAGDTYPRRPLSPAGEFSFELLRPGPYYVLVFRGADKDELPFIAPAEVGRSGLKGLEVKAPKPSRIEGRIIGSGALTRFALESAAAAGFARKDLRIDATGSFSLDGLPPGQWRISITPDHASYVKSMRFGAEDVLEKAFQTTDGLNPPLEIEISNRVARIIGNAPFTAVHLATRLEYRSDPLNMIGGLPPGEYEVSGLGQTVKLEEGETKTVQVDARKP